MTTMISVVRPEFRAATVQSLPAAPSRIAVAWRDLADGAAKSWMWTALAFQDIRLRYRGSVLGPFWLTISTLVMAAAMGLVYSRLFDMNIRTYLPYLITGLVVSWLKRAYGGGRCTWRGLEHFKAYVWSAVVAHNLVLFARLKRA